MSTNEALLRKQRSSDLTETLIRVGLIAFLAFLCARVFAPFASLMIWGLILAVALEPLKPRLARLAGGRRGLAATVLTLAGLALLGVPTVMLGSSFATHVQDVATAAHDGELHLPAPAPGVAEWPIVGKKVHAAWQSAAANLPAFLDENQAQLRELSRRGLAAAAETRDRNGALGCGRRHRRSLHTGHPARHGVHARGHSRGGCAGAPRDVPRHPSGAGLARDPAGNRLDVGFRGRLDDE